MNEAPWEIVAESESLHGYLRGVGRRYRLPDGTEHDWDIIDIPPTVAIVARTTTGEFLIARQFRPGAGAYLDELPGGRVDPGEEIEAAAARELLEETGYRAGELRGFGFTWENGRSTNPTYGFVATDCVKVHDGEFDDGEIIHLRLVSPDEFRAIVRRGHMSDQGIAYRGLDELGLLG